MTLQDDILDCLSVLDYPTVEELDLPEDSLDDLKFASIVSWLSMEAQKCLKLESNVNPIDTAQDMSCFKLELNTFLRELEPPFDFKNVEDVNIKYRLIHYLCGEVLAARLIFHRENTIKMSESDTAKDLKSVVISLALGKPPASITSEALFNKVEDKLKQIIQSGRLKVEEPVFLKKGMHLNLNQWNKLSEFEAKLTEEYTLRRQMLITRCDCTVGSFKWKGGEQNGVDEVYTKLRSLIASKSDVTLAHVLAAKESDCDTLFNSVVSTDHQTCTIVAPDTKGQANAGRQQRLSLHKYIIGYVPDRGGRPTEQQAPQQESFEQQQRSREQQQQRFSDRGGGRGGGGGGGPSRGGHSGQASQKSTRVQGAGWNQGDHRGGDRGNYEPRQRNHDNASGYGSSSSSVSGERGGGGYHRREDMQGGGGYYSQNQNWNHHHHHHNQGGGGGGYQPQHDYRHHSDGYGYHHQDGNYQQNYQHPQERHYQERNFRRGGGSGGGGGGGGGGRRNY